VKREIHPAVLITAVVLVVVGLGFFFFKKTATPPPVEADPLGLNNGGAATQGQAGPSPEVRAILQQRARQGR